MHTSTFPTVHRVEGKSLPVNAYLVETERDIVAVDSLLTVSDSRALRARVESLGKPLRAVLVTHAHPDHYGGLTALVDGDDVPIIASVGVDRVIRRDDEAKEAILRPMFGDEWARSRTFPTHTVHDTEAVSFGGVTFRIIDLGPGESPHDSIWVLEGDEPRPFIGDLIYNHMHAYLADGYYEEWLANLARVKEIFTSDTVVYPGHGEPASMELLDWQASYIRTFLDAVRSTLAVSGSPGTSDDAATGQVTARMKEYLHGEGLLFLMQLSVAPVRARLAASTAGGGGDRAER